jgi:hypothetical protein
MGASVPVAYIFHAMLALVAIVVAVWIWRKPVDNSLKAAGLAIGTLMITPFILDYDLTILSIPIACLAVYEKSNNSDASLIDLLVIVWFAPILLRFANGILPFTWAPLLLSALLYKTAMLVRMNSRCIGH